MRLFDHLGRPVSLGPEIRRGGEGAVFELDGDRTRVAKRYLKAPERQKAEKIAFMVQSGTSKLTEYCAWPSASLHEKPGGPMVGFVMPRVTGREIHLVTNPQSRRQFFPATNFTFIAHVATNCAAAFEEIQKAGHVVGDINEGNVLVDEKGLVRFIDCDSFQIRGPRDVYRCEVAMDTFTPPELQGADLQTVIRTSNHDAFGLAVLLFQLLFLGRHPFAGRLAGRTDQVEPKDAIRDHRFAFGRGAASKGVAPPPFAVLLGDVGSDVGELFERAFSERSDFNGRPSPTEWHQMLGRFQRSLSKCAVDDSHFYPAQLQRCLWCRIAGDGGPAFFVSVRAAMDFAIRTGDFGDLVTRLERLLAAPSASLDPFVPPKQAPYPLSPAVVTKAQRLRKLHAGSLWAVGAVSIFLPAFTFAQTSELGIALIISGVLLSLLLAGSWFMSAGSELGQEHRNRANAAKAAEERSQRATEAWKQLAAEYCRAQDLAREAVTRLRREPVEIQGAYLREKADLERRAADIQRAEFLKRQVITQTAVPGIGAGRAAILRAHGIANAFDVLTAGVRHISGFRGAGKLSSNLDAWARAQEVRFRFDASKGVPEHERRALVAKFRSREQQCLFQLLSAAEALNNAVAENRQRAASTNAEMRSAAIEREKTKADLEVVQNAVGAKPRSRRHAWIVIPLVWGCEALFGAAAAPSPPVASLPPVPTIAVQDSTPAAIPLPRTCALRDAPASSAHLVAMLKEGDSVRVEDRQPSGWRKVSLESGLRGWTAPHCWQASAPVPSHRPSMPPASLDSEAPTPGAIAGTSSDPNDWTVPICRGLPHTEEPPEEHDADVGRAIQLGSTSVTLRSPLKLTLLSGAVLVGEIVEVRPPSLCFADDRNRAMRVNIDDVLTAEPAQQP